MLPVNRLRVRLGRGLIPAEVNHQHKRRGRDIDESDRNREDNRRSPRGAAGAAPFGR